MYNDIELHNVLFLAEPHIDERTTSKNNTRKENKDIAKYPFMVVEDIPFEIRFAFKGCQFTKEIILSDTIPAGYVYNMADIPFFLQPISYDKHSPFVRNASLIHDYILEHKEELYKMWKLEEYGLDHRDFRILSSDVFEAVLIQAGVPEKKARLMRNSVDVFQKLVCWSWMGIDK